MLEKIDKWGNDCLMLTCSVIYISQDDWSNFNSLLLWTQLHSHNELTFGRNSFQDICLQTTQHVRTQDIMKLLDLIFFSNILKLCQKTVLVSANNSEQKSVVSGLSWSECTVCLCTFAFLWCFEDKLMLLFVVFGNLGQHLLSALCSIYRKSLVKFLNLCISL